MCGWQGGWGHFRGAIFGIGWKRRAVALTPAEVRVESRLGFRAALEGGKLGRVVILGFTAARRTFSALRCPYNRHSGLRGNPAS